MAQRIIALSERGRPARSWLPRLLCNRRSAVTVQPTWTPGAISGRSQGEKAEAWKLRKQPAVRIVEKIGRSPVAERRLAPSNAKLLRLRSGA